MTTPYDVPLTALTRRVEETSATGPQEPTGEVPVPVEVPSLEPLGGPFDPALPLAALGLHL